MIVRQHGPRKLWRTSRVGNHLMETRYQAESPREGLDTPQGKARRDGTILSTDSNIKAQKVDPGVISTRASDETSKYSLSEDLPPVSSSNPSLPTSSSTPSPADMARALQRQS